MKDLKVLLVEPDPAQARLLAHNIACTALVHPAHVPNGEAAVLWVGTHECNVCLLSYELPGIDGLQTLVRIHQRKPNLPVIMMSNDKSPRVAVDAFHLGVHDYVIKQPGYHDTIAQLIQQIKQAEASELPIVQQAPPNVPTELLRPSYQNRLRAIGRQLDLYGYHTINVLEVGGGFLVRALTLNSYTPEALEFPDRDFLHLIASGFNERGEKTRNRSPSLLLPTGYEEFLRALGYQLDIRMAEAITITELDSFIAVSGLVKPDDRNDTRLAPFQILMRPPDISQLLEEAKSRRTGYASPAFARLLGYAS